MARTNRDDTTAEPPAEMARSRASEAFSILNDETRLAILLALWEAFDPFAATNAVPFSDLRERVGMRDSGQFNYHLNKLTGHFVQKTDDGYTLRRAGHQLVQAVISGTGIQEPALEQTEIDNECGFCGAPTAVVYQDERLYIVCTECEGFFTGNDHPEGSLTGATLDPAGFTNRTPEEMLRTALTAGYRDILSAIEGICDACSGPIERSLHICDEHAADGVCDNCGRRFAIMARFRCPVCKNHHNLPPRSMVAQHPAVIAFYYDHGISSQYEVDDFESFQQWGNLIGEHDQELVSEDPVRIRVTIQYEGDELHLTLDEHLDVIDVTESE